MATPYNPLAALNPQSKLLAAPDTFWDRTKWLRAPEMMRSAMLGALAGAPNPLAMAIAGAAAGLDTGREQMYGHDPKMDQVSMAAVGDPKKMAARVAARLGRGAAPVPAEPLVASNPLTELIVPQRGGNPAQVIPTGPVPEGMVRLYRGQRSDMQPVPEDPPLWQNGERGRWFTTDEDAARWYGPNVHYVDVPEAVSHESVVPDSMLNKTGRLIPAQYANQARPYPPLTGADVLAQAAQKAPISFSKFVKQNPAAGADLFDLSTAQPAIPGIDAQIERYIPPRGLPARVADALSNPTVKKRLVGMVEQGKRMMPESWYRTSPLYEAMHQELGPEAASDAYKQLMEMVSATSPQSKVQDNIRIASYYNYLLSKGLPLPPKPAPGYGAKTQGLHLQNVRNFSGEGLDPLQNPKPAAFVANLMGNETPVTIDTHNFKALGMASRDPRFLATTAVQETKIPGSKKTIKTTIRPQDMYESGELTMADALKDPSVWASSPKKTEYAGYEAWQQKQAAKLGMTPAEWQEKMWIGGGKQTGLGSLPEPFLRTLSRRLAYTAHRTGRDPKQVLKQFVRGEIPLLELFAPLLGGAAAGAAASKDDEQR